MTSETPNLHVSKNLNISKTKQDIEKLKTPLRLVWKCCSDAFQIGSTIFCRRGTLRLNVPVVDPYNLEKCENFRFSKQFLGRQKILKKLECLSMAAT